MRGPSAGGMNAGGPSAGGPILELRHVDVDFVLADGERVSALSDVSLEVGRGEIVGIVGESGSGKSTLALAVIGLLGGSARVRGEIAFEGRDLLGLGDGPRRSLRGDRLSMVFQDPTTSLDPAFSIGEQVAETIRAHRRVPAAGARSRALELLIEVGIPAAERRYDDAPHRLSGGMRQRVVVATALANEPALLIADEPTTALDVTIQAQILDLLRSLRDRHGTAVLLITHDLGVVAQICDRVAVLYAGQLVEFGSVDEIFSAPRHPYTEALLAAQPTARQARGALRVIEGQVPDLTDPPPGCRFAPRCPVRRAECVTVPPLALTAGGHRIACWADPATRAAAADGSVAGGSTHDSASDSVAAAGGPAR
ncbi:MAG TPA: ABC transporter ATP-binding protein [Candidatus Deferrimicrobium sp.]|nr:ABC transporter ATP-binding protein [Candidatus Deferrimicrobium sp.]